MVYGCSSNDRVTFSKKIIVRHDDHQCFPFLSCCINRIGRGGTVFLGTEKYHRVLLSEPQKIRALCRFLWIAPVIQGPQFIGVFHGDIIIVGVLVDRGDFYASETRRRFGELFYSFWWKNGEILGTTRINWVRWRTPEVRLGRNRSPSRRDGETSSGTRN